MNPLKIPSLIKTGLGIGQNIGAALSGKNKRPDYKIPNAIVEASQATKQQANLTERPGASAAISVINQNKANTVDTINNMGGSASNVMQGLMSAQGQENNALLGEQSKNEEFRFQSFRDNINQLRQLGQYQEAEWNWNKADKYLEKRDRRDALIQGGLNNLVGGADDIVATDLAAEQAGLGELTMKDFWRKRQG